MRGIHRSPVNSPHQGQWRGALLFSLIYAWINDWVNNIEASDLRRHRAHYDVTVVQFHYFPTQIIFNDTLNVTSSQRNLQWNIPFLVSHDPRSPCFSSHAWMTMKKYDITVPLHEQHGANGHAMMPMWRHCKAILTVYQIAYSVPQQSKNESAALLALYDENLINYGLAYWRNWASLVLDGLTKTCSNSNY